jgi:hypothetical protein
MAEEKSISGSFRLTPRFKRLLQTAAQRDHWSQTNLLETLLFSHCGKHGLGEDEAARPSPDNRDENK